MMSHQYEAINSFVCETRNKKLFIVEKGEVYMIPDDIADELLEDGLIKVVNVRWN